MIFLCPFLRLYDQRFFFCRVITNLLTSVSQVNFSICIENRKIKDKLLYEILLNYLIHIFIINIMIIIMKHFKNNNLISFLLG